MTAIVLHSQTAWDPRSASNTTFHKPPAVPEGQSVVCLVATERPAVSRPWRLPSSPREAQLMQMFQHSGPTSSLTTSFTELLLRVLPHHHRAADVGIEGACDPEHGNLQTRVEQRQQRRRHAALLIAKQHDTPQRKAVVLQRHAVGCLLHACVHQTSRGGATRGGCQEKHRSTCKLAYPKRLLQRQDDCQAAAPRSPPHSTPHSPMMV